MARLRDRQPSLSIAGWKRGSSRIQPYCREFGVCHILEGGPLESTQASFGCQRTAVSLFITDMPARPRVTALRRSQRRFSDGVTAVETPFQSSGK